MDVDQIEVPPFFLCPISLEIMGDPVTVSTGITYDRESIEKWLISSKNQNCPVTKQSLSESSDLTPNHTLRRLIQAWCTVNAVDRIPTPKPPVSRSEISKLLRESKRSPQSKSASLRRLRSIASESEANRRCLNSFGVGEFIVSSMSFVDEEALSVLHGLRLSEPALKSILKGRETAFVETLIRVLSQGQTLESRSHAAIFLNSIFECSYCSIETMTCHFNSGFFSAAVNLLRDDPKPALSLLIATCPFGRNRVRAVEAGAVKTLVEMLLECSTERRKIEMVLTALESLVGCAEGRAELAGHGAGLAVVSKKVLRVSSCASERAVRVLLAVARHSPAPAVVAEMASIGVVAKMCLVLQVDCGAKTKEKAREILRIHARAWRNSPCVPSHLLTFYPIN